MPAKHQPDLIYLRYVPLWKVHVFTLVQLTCLVLLWVIKASAAAVVFPMMVTSRPSTELRGEYFMKKEKKKSFEANASFHTTEIPQSEKADVICEKTNGRTSDQSQCCWHCESLSALS